MGNRTAPGGIGSPLPRWVLRLAAAACSMVTAGNVAEAQPSLEYKVKAVFLLNFTKYIDWPASAFADKQAPFTMCILGKDPFGSALESVIEGETVQGRKLVVRQVEQTPPQQACQVLFISEPASDLTKILKDAGPGVLTVGEIPSFIADGGMVGFVLDHHKVRFDINQPAAERGMLKLSSRLLKVARVVQR